MIGDPDDDGSKVQRSSCFAVPSPRTSLLLTTAGLFGLGFVAIAAAAFEEAGNLLFPVGFCVGGAGALVLFLLGGGCGGACAE